MVFIVEQKISSELDGPTMSYTPVEVVNHKDKADAFMEEEVRSYLGENETLDGLYTIAD